jgi:long-chain acyl-CoA synthetase
LSTSELGTGTPASLSELIAQARRSLAGPGTPFEVVREEIRGTPLPVFKNRTPSLRGLLDASARFADRTYLVDGETRISYQTNLQLADALASALQGRYGVKPGDRVAIFAANRWEWIVAFWATVAAGAIPCAFNGWWTADEYAAAARLVEPVLVIGDAARLERAAHAGIVLPMLDLDTGLPGLLIEFSGATPAPSVVAEDDPALLMFTSGTTGTAKAVMIPHRAACGFYQVTMFAEAVGRVLMGGPRPAAGDLAPPSDDVILVTSPLFHVSMLYGATLAGVVKGSTIVLLPGRFDPERVLRVIEHERVTLWMALGSAAPRVSASPALARYDTSSVRYVGIGGAPVSPAVQQAIRDAFPAAAPRLGMGYTSTEAGSMIANIADPEYSAFPTSTGSVAATVEVELRDELGKRVPDGEPGEVHVRSAYLMLGYWNDPAASAAVLKEGGWLAMGDVARFRDGRLYIDSRARDMILVSAENVSPTEVEYRLEAHPDVVEAAVLAVDDALTGDAVCAVVVVAESSKADAGALAAWCRNALAHYKVPTRWHLTHEPLPRTATGKLVKTRLRDRIDRGELS